MDLIADQISHRFGTLEVLDKVSFQVASGALTVTAPSSGKLAPPGPYMLFLVNQAGVPSVGQIVLVGP